MGQKGIQQILLCGFMGCGKTSVGQALSFQLRWEGKMLKLWFVGDGGEIPLVQEENFVEYGPVQQNLRVYELSDGAFCVAGESDTAWSVVYTVCDGVPVEQEIGKVSDFSQQEDGSFIGMASDLVCVAKIGPIFR